jgi:hypothetical protein
MEVLVRGQIGDLDLEQVVDPDGTIWVGGNTHTLFHGTAYA